jgi:hypothetical protein
MRTNLTLLYHLDDLEYKFYNSRTFSSFPLGVTHVLRFHSGERCFPGAARSLPPSLFADDFSKSNADGWTVAALLAHLAFWDNRMFILLHRWQEHGMDESPVDPNMINDSLRPLCLALEPRVAV